MKPAGILVTAGILLCNTINLIANADYTYYSGDYTIIYDISGDNTISIKKCSGNGETFYIPDTIDGIPVAEIQPSAFVTCTNIRTIKISNENQYFSVRDNMLMNHSGNTLIKYTGTDNKPEIPYGIETIRSHAFFGSQAEYIEIPETVSYIDDYAFVGCTYLKSIEIPERVEYIGKGCFFSCPYLNSVVLPQGIEKICDDTFYACPSLQELIIPESVLSIGTDILSPSDNISYNPVIYGFYRSPAKEYAENNNITYKMIGDVNNDSVINASDSSYVLSDYASVSSGKESSLNHSQAICADINGDGVINASDASAILSKYAEISSGG